MTCKSLSLISKSFTKPSMSVPGTSNNKRPSSLPNLIEEAVSATAALKVIFKSRDYITSRNKMQTNPMLLVNITEVVKG